MMDNDETDLLTLALTLDALTVPRRRGSGSGWVFLVSGALLLVLLLGSPRLPDGPLRTAADLGPDTGAAPCAPDDLALQCPPSLTAAEIDAILATYDSPATGTGASWVDQGVQTGIDPAWALAFFIHESSAGTNPAWAGWKPDGMTTHNVGNIICAGYPTCHGRFRDYAGWEAGIADWYRLIADEYIQQRGHRTVADVIPVYAPAVENDVSGYTHAVTRLVAAWRSDP